MEREQPEIVSRREFLRRAGRYSAAAAAALAGSSLLSGCDILSPKDGSSLDRAEDYEVDESRTVVLTADKPDYYCGFDLLAAGGYELSITATTESMLPIQVTLYGSDGAQLETLSYSLYEGYVYGGTFNAMETVRYVLQFQRNPAGDASITYRLYNTSTYGDYSDGSYSDYSDSGWSNYSDYSRWADAYSDWSNAWGNWMESW